MCGPLPMIGYQLPKAVVWRIIRRITGLGINIDKQPKELREKKYFCEIKVLKHNDYKWMNRCEV